MASQSNAATKTAGKATNKAADKPVSKTPGKATNKTADKSLSKAVGEARNKTADKPAVKAVKKSASNAADKSASELISEKIAGLGDWRGDTLARMRALIGEADPDIVEEVKWMGTPVWSHDGGICTGESYKSVVKLTFFKGASLKDPAKLFNSSLDGNVRRAIDIHKGEKIDEIAFKSLIRAAVALNTSGEKKSLKRK